MKNKKIVLFSQPIIVGKNIGSEQQNGSGSLLIANVTDRNILVNHEIYNTDGTIITEGYDTIHPHKISSSNSLVGGQDINRWMYCKIWFEGCADDIRASFVMSIMENGGSPGNEIFIPAYSVIFS